MSKTPNFRMAINNGDEANSNTEVDNVVSIAFKISFQMAKM